MGPEGSVFAANSLGDSEQPAQFPYRRAQVHPRCCDKEETEAQRGRGLSQDHAGTRMTIPFPWRGGGVVHFRVTPPTPAQGPGRDGPGGGPGRPQRPRWRGEGGAGPRRKGKEEGPFPQDGTCPTLPCANTSSPDWGRLCSRPWQARPWGIPAPSPPAPTGPTALALSAALTCTLPHPSRTPPTTEPPHKTPEPLAAAMALVLLLSPSPERWFSLCRWLQGLLGTGDRLAHLHVPSEPNAAAACPNRCSQL